MALTDGSLRLSRRHWIRLAGAGSLGVLAAGCAADPSPAAPTRPVAPGGASVVHRSLSIPNIALFNNIDSQRCMEWCWAACAETIVRQFNVDVNGFLGFSVAQEYFANKVYGRVTLNTCLGAVPSQMAFALSDTYRLRGSGARIALQGYSYMPIPASFDARAVSLIKNQIPFAILLVPAGQSSGHFLTVYQLAWTEDAAGNFLSIDSYTMADPAQNLYQFFPGVPRYPSVFTPLTSLSFTPAGVVWAERVG